MDLETLNQLTELKYQKSLSGLSGLLAREAELRAEIERLKALAYETQAMPLARHSMRNIGADVIWLQWVAKTTRHLNMELAQVLAQKEMLLANQRRALGRKTVAQNLVDAELQNKRSQSRSRSLTRAIDMSLILRNRGQ